MQIGRRLRLAVDAGKPTRLLHSRHRPGVVLVPSGGQRHRRALLADALTMECARVGFDGAVGEGDARLGVEGGFADTSFNGRYSCSWGI
eukprot:7067680-Prymnesium_polylepis.1